MRMRAPILIVAAVAMLLAAATGQLEATKGDPEIVSPAKPLDLIALTDHSGLPFTNEKLNGKWSLILLGFTQCPDICPFTLQNLAHIIEEMSLRVSPDRLPQVIFVGVDKDRDQPILGDYVHSFNPDFVGVTGEWANITTLVEGVEGFARIEGKEPGKDNYQVHHSASVAVIDPQGRLVAQVSPPMEPKVTAIFLTGLMRQYAKETN